MMHISTTNFQAISMFLSSWALVFLALGILVDDWVKLNFETPQNGKHHSPWIHTTIWPNDDLEVVRVMMTLVLSFSFFHNFLLGLEFTYMIPQIKCIIFVGVFLSIFTGILLFCALLLYHLKLKQGLFVYYRSYKISWIISTAYFSVFLLIASGILSFLQYKQSMNSRVSPTSIEISASESQEKQESGSSIQVISLPERIALPRSIVHAHSEHSHDSTLEKSPMPKRRVTWAL